MKKTLAFLLATMMFIACLALFSLSTSAASNKAVQAAWGTPVIDGTIDEIWATAPISKFSRGSCQVRVMNDATNVYFLVEIEDSTNELMSRDILYLLFDLNNDGKFDHEKLQLNFERDYISWTILGGVVYDESEMEETFYLVDWKKVQSDNGFIYEIALNGQLPESVEGEKKLLTDSGNVLMEIFYRERDNGGSGFEGYWSTAGHDGGWPTNDCPTDKYGVLTFATEDMKDNPPVKPTEPPVATTPEETDPPVVTTPEDTDPDASTAPDSSAEDIAPVTTDNKGDEDNDEGKFPVVPVVIAVVVVAAIIVAVVLLKKKK